MNVCCGPTVNATLFSKSRNLYQKSIANESFCGPWSTRRRRVVGRRLICNTANSAFLIAIVPVAAVLPARSPSQCHHREETEAEWVMDGSIKRQSKCPQFRVHHCLAMLDQNHLVGAPFLPADFNSLIYTHSIASFIRDSVKLLPRNMNFDRTETCAWKFITKLFANKMS